MAEQPLFQHAESRMQNLLSSSYFWKCQKCTALLKGRTQTDSIPF